MEKDPLKIAYNRIGPIGEATFSGPNSNIIQSAHNMIRRTYNAMLERSDDKDYEPIIIIYADNRIVYEMGRVDGGIRLTTINEGHSEWMGFKVIRVQEDDHLACVCINPPDTNCKRILRPG